MSVRHRVREEERSRFRAEDFAHLNVGEIISYNKGREGRRQKVTKGNAEYIFCTERPNGVAAVNYEGMHIDYAHVKTARNVLAFSQLISG